MYYVVSNMLRAGFGSPGCQETAERGTGQPQQLDTLPVHMTRLDQMSTRHQNLLVARHSPTRYSKGTMELKRMEMTDGDGEERRRDVTNHLLLCHRGCCIRSRGRSVCRKASSGSGGRSHEEASPCYARVCTTVKQNNSVIGTLGD